MLSLTAKADLQYILCDEKFYDWFVPLETSGVHLMEARTESGTDLVFPTWRLLSQPRSLPWQGGGGMTRSSCSHPAPPPRAKGVIIKNYSIMHAIVSYQRIFQITDRDTTLIPIPIYLVTGLVALLGLTLYAGGTVYLHKFFDAKRVLRDVNDKGNHISPRHRPFFPCC